MVHVYANNHSLKTSVPKLQKYHSLRWKKKMLTSLHVQVLQNQSLKTSDPRLQKTPLPSLIKMLSKVHVV